jgi:SpoU rRNA methylase family enzyme
MWLSTLAMVIMCVFLSFTLLFLDELKDRLKFNDSAKVFLVEEAKSKTKMVLKAIKLEGGNIIKLGGP